MQQALQHTAFNLHAEQQKYEGKVRDVYTLPNDQLVMVATDRISAFDHILPKPIPQKGQVLNTIAARFLRDTQHIVPNWLEAVPHPAVAIGKRCEPIKLEMVIRGYLVGHAWREYSAGKRTLCGAAMPEGMRQNEAFPQPIITPATKADSGHDEDISPEEIIEKQIVSAEVYEKLAHYTRALYAHGVAYAEKKGLILVDTKYEFGWYNGQIMLMDEIHTPDSSRYFYRADYAERLEEGLPQRHLSKEFVREWLMDKGFQGMEGQNMPEMTDRDVEVIRQRYFELYQQIMGQDFEPDLSDATAIEEAVKKYLH